MRRSGFILREGTSNTILNAIVDGDLVSGALVSRPCSWSGPPAVLHPVWRSHAQAPSGDVQSGTGATLDRERSHRLSAELSLVLGTDRKKPCNLSPSPIFARHAPLQELRATRAIHRRGSLGTTQVQTPSVNRTAESFGISFCSLTRAALQRAARVVFLSPVIWQRDSDCSVSQAP